VMARSSCLATEPSLSMNLLTCESISAPHSSSSCRVLTKL